MNTEENQEITAMEEDFGLPDHPVLSFPDDEFLSTVVERLTSLAQPHSPAKFSEIMENIIFHDLDIDLQQISFCENTVCSKSINKGEIYFVCLDCDICAHPDIYALMCIECFDKSNHKGHRLRIIRENENSSANCDCGDAQSLKPEGFCSDHQFKPINIPELYENFPGELRVKYERLVKKSIYGVVSLFEMKQYQPLALLSKESFDSLSELAEELMSEMLNFWIECYSEVNRAFLPILWTTFRGQFDGPWDLVLHDCEDLRAENKNPQEPHKCTCSLLGNLFRIGNVMNKENQEKLKKILVECVKDQDFLGYLAVEFTKYIHFFFTQNYNQEILEDDTLDNNSLVLGLYIQLYKDDNILVKVLDSGYFGNFLDMMKKVVDGCMEINLTVFKIIDQVRFMLDYFLVPRNISAQRVAKDQEFMLQFLDIIMTYQMKFFYTDGLTTSKFNHQIKYDSLNIVLRTERRLCRSFENYIKLIYDLPDDEQKKAILQFLKHWEMNLQNAKAALKDEDGKSCQSFNPCLERLFCCVILGHLKNKISKESLQEFLGGTSASEIGLNTIEGPLRALGMVRYLHLTFNYKAGEIFYVYYFIWNAFFETDVVMTQMMMLLLKPEKELFGLLVDNFFSYSPEIREFFNNPNEENYEKKMLTVIEDFLYFLVFLMTDEICLLNVEGKYKKDNFGDLEFSPRQRSVAKNLIVNILRGYYWTTGKEVKEIFERFLCTEAELDQIISQVTIQDEKSHKIRIKDEYESSMNPYIFYRMPAIRQDFVETFKAKNSQKNNSIDFISESGLDKDVPLYLKEIQVRLYQSNLPEFLIKYLKTTTNLKTGTTLIRLVLKLILLNLQVAKESSLLKYKIEENYLTEDFLQTLNNISMEESLKDCQNCIKNIKDLLMLRQSQSQSQTTDMLIENSPRTENSEDEKKKMTAQERMAQLKQDFAQKQAMFAEKNKYLMSKSVSSEGINDGGDLKNEESLVCQQCMEKLHVSGQEYGLPIYITFTNNFYDGKEEENFVEQDYTNFLKTDWWPVISSCNHYYHRKCFEILYKAPKGFEQNLLSNAYESFCPLCKGLCNNFLSINGEEKESDEMNQEAPQNEVEMYPQVYQSFTKKIQKLLVDLKAKIQLSPAGHATALEEAAFISIETIFERAYQYFIESFYLLENAQTLVKSFELYLAFFKGFKSYFKNPENKIPEDNLQLSAFFNVTNLFLSTQASCPSNFLNYKTEVYLVELLAKNLQRILATSNISGQSELFALKDFILLKVIQTIAFDNNSGDLSNLKLEDCLTMYQSNQTLRSMILKEVMFPIQKIILSCALNTSTVSSSLNLPELFDLLYSEPNNQEEYLTNLFQAVNIPCSFPEFIIQIFQELPSRLQSEINFLNSLFDEKLFNKETLKPQLVKFAPRMIQLPENYLEFNTHYFPQKCNLCKKYSSHLFTSICLICGEIMCTSYCNDDVNQAGNLNRHSKKYHMGMGVFLDMQGLYQNLVNTPLNLSCEKKSLYLDGLGQDITSLLDSLSLEKIAKLNFTEFKINQDYLKELGELINQQNLRKDLFTVGIRIVRKKKDGFL